MHQAGPETEAVRGGERNHVPANGSWEESFWMRWRGF
jgi:hypothetical protein